MIQRVVAYVNQEWVNLLWPASLFLGVIAAGWAIRRILFSRLRRWTASTKTKFDDVLVESLHGPFLLWVVILAIHLAAEFSKLPREFTKWSAKVLLSLWIISLTLGLMRFSRRLVRVYGDRFEGALPVGTLTQLLAGLLIGLLGLLELLHVFDISLTPILTALGVGGLAVALALQDTLSNFFAGFYVSLARQIRIGDFIKLDSGQEGHVADIGWRSTTLRTPSNSLVVIPNSKLAQSIVTNFYLPERRMSIGITVGVGYDCDLSQVERVLNEVASAAAGEVPGMLKDPPPGGAVISSLGDSAVNFTLGCCVAEYKYQPAVQHELRKRILRRFREEGIDIPFPTRTIEIKPRPAGSPEGGFPEKKV